MRLLNGYVCVASLTRHSHSQKVMFGRSVSNRNKGYENLQTNGIQVYDILPDAMGAVYELSQVKEFGTVDVKNLRMLIAEKEEELEKLRGKKSLVVIQLERERVKDITERLLNGVF